MTIRPATLADVPRLVAGFRQFVATSHYAAFVPDAPAHVTALSEHLVTAPTTTVLVTETDAGVTGLLGLGVTAHPYSGQRLAVEVIWWVAPEARGCGPALLRAGERWAAEQGADAIQMIAPADAAGRRVGRFYERRGYQAVETTYYAPVTAALTAITVVDEVRPDFPAYQARARAQTVGDLATADLVFHGIGHPPDDTLPQWIATRWPALTPTLSLLRRSPAGQVEPHLIHTDADMGDWTAILYLTDDPPVGDGTTFWRSRATGARASTAATADAAAWADLTQWEPWTTVAARPNRLVLFPAAYYHARAIPENYGLGATARLIQLVFGTGTVPVGG
jgi:GNAT superfamily N-acetyltransferase